ncbi:hypothetical protein O3M35_013182 [Rhynocoris fuscipes]|uniref:Uncharacterized protein n=1 Tax=Rhynocoris fuscipes TaxID=488301 RepID=A0AAW1CDY9_9HEMI
MEYLANHLTSDECWKLTVLLHSNNVEEIELNNKLQQPIVTQINCLEDLLHWNSLPGEGLDETHQILAYNLRLIGRNDLSDWLSETVFEELAKDINKTLLIDPFEELIKTTNKTEDLDIVGAMERINGDHDLWKPYDTILSAITLSLIITLIWVICKIIKISCIQRVESRQTIRKSRGYERIPMVYREYTDDETIAASQHQPKSYYS